MISLLITSIAIPRQLFGIIASQNILQITFNKIQTRKERINANNYTVGDIVSADNAIVLS